MRWWLGVLAALTVGGAWGSAAAASGSPPPPDRDPFYAAPASLGSYATGAVVRWRVVDVSIGSVPMSALGATAYQLLYRTDDPLGRPMANVTTVIVPSGARPGGGRALVSLQDAEDSLATNCAPSYQLRVGERDNSDLAAEMPAAAPSQLSAGRVLVVPDVYGPRSEFLVTPMEAHATLDSIRAAESFPPAQLNGSLTPVALVGYSGGGHETMAAAELQPTYAPELNVVGVAAGGTPAGDRETFDYLDGRTGSGVEMGAMIALQRAHPSVRWSGLLNAYGRRVAAREASGPGCVTPVVSGTDRASQWTTVPDPLSVRRIAAAVAANALGQHAPTAPAFLYVSQHDELISLNDSDKLAVRWCSDGAHLDYFRDPTDYVGPLGDHLEAALAGFIPRALAYLNDRFAGRSSPSTCSPRPPAAAQRSCPASRVVTLRLRLPAGLHVQRIRVTVNGRRARFTRRGRRAVRVSVPANTSGRLRIIVRVIGHRHGRHREIDFREDLAACT
jgi:Secretory lipase